MWCNFKGPSLNTAKALMKCKHLLLFFWMSHIIEDPKTQKQMKREKRFSHKVEAKWLACSPYTAAQAASFMYMYESPYTCESHLYLRSKCHVQKPNSKLPIFNLVYSVQFACVELQQTKSSNCFKPIPLLPNTLTHFTWKDIKAWLFLLSMSQWCSQFCRFTRTMKVPVNPPCML